MSGCNSRGIQTATDNIYHSNSKWRAATQVSAGKGLDRHGSRHYHDFKRPITTAAREMDSYRIADTTQRSERANQSSAITNKQRLFRNALKRHNRIFPKSTSTTTQGNDTRERLPADAPHGRLHSKQIRKRSPSCRRCRSPSLFTRAASRATVFES